MLIRYSCHCWTTTFVPDLHDGLCVFSDHMRPRVYDAERHARSYGLGAFIEQIQRHRCLLTPAKRNFMAYNASVPLADGSFYKIFFKLQKERGSIANIRHSLSLTVESAYVSSDPIAGMSIRFDAIVASVLRDKPIFYKP